MKKGALPYLKAAITGFKHCWVPIHILAFVTIVPIEVLLVVFHGFVSGPTADVTYGTVLMLVGFLTFVQAYLAVLFFCGFIILLGKEGKKCNFLMALRIGQPRFPYLLAAFGAWVFIIAGGLVALIGPGIYMAVVFLFMPFIVVLEKKGVYASFKRSYALVKGRWWSVAWRLWPTVGLWAGFTVLAFFVPNVPYLTGLFMAALVDLIIFFSMIYLYVIYRDLKQLR